MTHSFYFWSSWLPLLLRILAWVICLFLFSFFLLFFFHDFNDFFFQIRVFLVSQFLLSGVHFFVEVLPSLFVVQVPFFYDGFLSGEVGCYCGDYSVVVGFIFPLTLSRPSSSTIVDMQSFFHDLYISWLVLFILRLVYIQLCVEVAADDSILFLLLLQDLCFKSVVDLFRFVDPFSFLTSVEDSYSYAFWSGIQGDPFCVCVLICCCVFFCLLGYCVFLSGSLLLRSICSYFLISNCILWCWFAGSCLALFLLSVLCWLKLLLGVILCFLISFWCLLHWRDDGCLFAFFWFWSSFFLPWSVQLAFVSCWDYIDVCGPECYCLSFLVGIFVSRWRAGSVGAFVVYSGPGFVIFLSGSGLFISWSGLFWFLLYLFFSSDFLELVYDFVEIVYV